MNVPLEKDYLHTLYFSNENEQKEYFGNKVVKRGSNFSYIRRDNCIRYPESIDKLYNCNYVMYQNQDHSSKWFYAFITKLEYVNDENTNIYIETDVMQTWMFNYTVKSSFVEREHVNDDTIGLHTIPEGLETGDYIVNKRNANESLLIKSLILGTTVDINTEGFENINGGLYNGVYSGVKYYELSHEQMTIVLKRLADAGKADAVVCIFTCPKYFVESSKSADVEFAIVKMGLECDKGSWVNTFGIDEEEIYKPTDLNGYVPKNNKLFTYPYCYMLMSNNSGGSALYKYEAFNCPDNANKCDFRIYSALTPGMSIRIVPRYYNGATNNNDEGLNLGKFPICSWSSDVYTNWLTQNGVNIGASVIGNVATVGLGVASVATGAGAVAGASMIASGVAGITSTVGEVYAHSKQPPQAEGNLNSGDVTFSAGYLTFTAHEMTIKKEYAQVIDGYFNMFGYKVNRVKVPNKNHRANYWYTKTIDVNIDGSLPQEDLQKIKNCYNKGITFWKNPANIQNYTVNNSIV